VQTPEVRGGSKGREASGLGQSPGNSDNRLEITWGPEKWGSPLPPGAKKKDPRCFETRM